MADSDDEDILYDNDLGRNLIGGKRVKNVDDVLNGGKKDKRKLRKTLALCMAFLCLGLCLAILGPTLLSLQEHLHTSLPKISWVFAGRSVGYLSGAILGGMLFESFNPLFLLAVTLLLCGIGIVIAPYMMTVMGLAVCISSVGVSMGVLDTGANLVCLRMWGKKRSGTMLQALHFSFAVGAFIAPLVAAPFLVETNSAMMANSTTSAPPVQSSTMAIPFINNKPGEPGGNTVNVHQTVGKGNQNGTANKENQDGIPDKENQDGTPDKENQDGTPDKENQNGTLDKENQDGTPDKENQDGTPDKENQDGTPDKENLDGTPDKENQNGTLDKENQNGTLDKENQDGTPDKENLDGTPDKENQNGTLDKENQDGTPDKENQDGTPDKENQDGTPDKENQDGTPDKENLDGTPDKENQNGTLDKENLDGTPDKENLDGTSRKKREGDEKSGGENKNSTLDAENKDGTPGEGNEDEYTNSEQPAPQLHVERFAIAYIIIGVMVLLTSGVFFYFLCTKPKDEPQYTGSENANKTSDMNNFPFRTRIIVLLFFFYFLYVGGEVAYGSFVSMFAIKSQHHFEQDRASHVAALFWGTFSLGRGLAICLASVISPLKMVIADMVGCVSTSVALTLLADSNENVLWICSAFLGLSMASLFPSGIAWLESYTPVTGNTASFLIVGSALGEMCVPLIIGSLFEGTLGPMVLMYWMLATSALSSLIFFYVMWLMASNGQEKESLPAEKSPALELFHSIEEALPMEEIFKNGGSNNKQLRKPPILKRKNHRE